MSRPPLLGMHSIHHWLEQRRTQAVRAEMVRQGEEAGVQGILPPYDPDPYRHNQIGEIEDVIAKMDRISRRFGKKKRRHRKRNLTTKPSQEAEAVGAEPAAVATGVLTPDSVIEDDGEPVAAPTEDFESEDKSAKLPKRQGAAKEAHAKNKKGKTAGTTPRLQTTLSLGPKPGFVECKECEIVYNPLNRKDVGHHNKRHALAGRRQAKATR